jgi:Arc/MetJ-type ribon-helix-helix transcriptional regulator
MNVALTDDLQRLLREKVENGPFPSEEAVVREALRVFLTEEAQSGPQASSTTEVQEQRTPGPFLEDEMVLPPVTIPRPGQEAPCSCLDGIARLPDRFPEP